MNGADTLLNSLPCGVVSFDDNGLVIGINDTLCALLGHAREDVAGQHVERLLSIAGRIFYQTHVFPLLKLHGKADELFLLMRRKDGSDVGVLANFVRHERNGTVVNDVAMLEVKERRKYEDELLRARREAESAHALLTIQTHELEAQHQLLQDQAAEVEAQSEELQELNDEMALHAVQLELARTAADEANHAKSQFLATMSHELRTPLNAIGGYVQLVNEGIYGEVTDAQRGALDRISRSQRHLLRLVNDVLNLARIEAGRVDYAVEDVPMRDVIASVVPMIEPQMATAGLSFSSAASPDCVARADCEKVQQVLINLLTNAVKFTPAGGSIRLEAAVDATKPSVLLHVTDTGIGVPLEKQRSIFEPFVQVDNMHTRRVEGSGLGLAISRDLARGMGGELTVESESGKGSTFTLVLPRA